MIYLDIVRRALGDLETSNNQTRRAIYQQLRDALTSALEEQDPPVPDQERTIEQRLLEMTIRQVESDLRAGIDVMSDDYQPAELKKEQQRLYALKVVSRDNRPTKQKQTDVTAYVEQLLAHITPISNVKTPLNYQEKPMRLGALQAVVLRLLRNQSAAQGRFGLLWIILEPMILVALIVSAYLVTGQKTVVNMPLIAFAVTGIIPWLMIRITLTRVGLSFTSNKELLALPPINMLTISFASGLIQLLIYMFGMVAALSALFLHGDAPAPENWVGCLAIFVGLWMYALTFGMILGSFANSVPVIFRATMIAMRFVGFLSSVFIVSEQLPEEFRFYTLANPLSHGFQLLRSEYFSGYRSTDASLNYFLFGLAIFTVAAVAMEWSRRPTFEPA